MRVSGRNADISAPAEGFAGLPLDIAFLTGIGIPPSALAEIAVRASRLGVAPSREIVASGLVTQTMFYRALAGELGLAFHVGRLALHPGGSYGAILREGMAVVAKSSGTRFRFALAPEGRALRRLLEAGPRQRDDIVVMTPADFAASLRASNGPALARHVAGLDQAGLGRDSARTGSSRGQRLVAGAGVASAAFCGTLAPFETFFAVALLLCPIFLGLIYLRLAAVVEPLGIDLWKTHRWRVDDSRLPIYTVAVPIYREEAVLPQLIAALSALDYPAAKLDILLLTEADDAGMAAALARLELPPCFTVLVVPSGHPRTKPRALNLALLEARGEYFTIFDAEDIPDPQQLRLAAMRFLGAPPGLACLQARLVINYAGEGLLPALFALEYAGLFEVLNPGLLRYRLPIMLGGTSNHFRTEALRAVGGWDAWNVTEDADLGLRLVRAGLWIGDLPSRTFEEAPLTIRAWLKQRARWIKGYMQTLVTHLRDPRLLLRQAGIAAGMSFLVLGLGTVVTALGYPIFAAAVAYAYGGGLFWLPGGHFGDLAMMLALTVWLFGTLAMLVPPAQGAGPALARAAIAVLLRPGFDRGLARLLRISDEALRLEQDDARRGAAAAAKSASEPASKPASH
jgi:cellulose synthase/poly-beta-1,6-N-acetylglucosamine synthase-like glycosyltransferase